MPKDFRQIAAAAAEDVEIAGMGIAFQSLLNLKRKTLWRDNQGEVRQAKLARSSRWKSGAGKG